MDISRKLDYAENVVERHLSSLYGHALRVLTSCPRRTWSLKSVGVNLWPAVMLDQIAFLYNSKGAPVAFASWAFLTPEVLDVLSREPDYALDVSEWNEGDQLWLMDFVAPYGDARNLIRKIRACYLPSISRIRGVRRYTDGKGQRLIDLAIRPQPTTAKPSGN